MDATGETRLKLLESAKREFEEKGFTKASLREICKNAGVTTGAMYFFFKDKDELFVCLVKDMIEEIYGIMMDHYSKESTVDNNELKEILESGIEGSEDEKVMEDVIRVLYRDRGMALMLLTKAQGSSMENIIDKFVDASVIQYEALAKRMNELYPDKKVSDHIPHWFAHDQINVIVYMVTHIETEEDAVKFVRNATAYLKGGWSSVWE